METFTFPCADLELRADLITGQAAGGHAQGRAVAMVLHGWTGRRSGSSRTIARRLAACGITCLVPDLPGHGESPGDRDALTRSQFAAAAVRSFDELLQRAVAAADVGARSRALVVGTSFGAYLATQVVARRPVDALALRVPANYPDEGWDDVAMGAVMGPIRAARRFEWLSRAQEPNATSALRAVAGFRGPVLVMEAADDQVIHPATPCNYVDAVGDPARCTHVVIHGAPHAMSKAPATLERANDELIEWVRRVL